MCKRLDRAEHDWDVERARWVGGLKKSYQSCCPDGLNSRGNCESIINILLRNVLANHLTIIELAMRLSECVAIES